MNMIRAVEHRDIPRLVDLHLRAEEGDDVSREQIEAAYNDHFAAMFLEHPWTDAGPTSLVAESPDGRIVGFMGIVPRLMSFAGREITMAVGTQLTVDVAARSKLLGLQLLKRLLRGPQDLTVADYANATTRRIWESMGGSTAHLYSLSWSRLLNPGRLIVERLAGRQGLRALTPFARPLARLFDHSTSRVPRIPWALPSTDAPRQQLTAEELTSDTYARLLPDFTRHQTLTPVVDKVSSAWLFDRLDRMYSSRSVHRVLLRDEQQLPLGWFVYNREPDGSAEVAQIVASRNHQADVVDHLIRHARSSGATAISGRVQPELLYTFSEFRCHLHTTPEFALVHSRDPQLLRPFETGTAFLSLLEGEGCLYLPVREGIRQTVPTVTTSEPRPSVIPKVAFDGPPSGKTRALARL
jgi:hypothetical protein